MSTLVEALLAGGSLLALRTGARRPPPAARWALEPPLSLGLGLARLGLGPLGGGASVGAFSPWPLGGTHGRELVNKLRIFDAFHRRAPLLAFRGASLEERVRVAWGAASEDRLFMVEGLGFAHAAEAWNQGEPPRRLLTDLPAKVVPEAARLTLHTGMGLLLAGRWLWLLGARGGAIGSRDLTAFRELCHDNAGAGLGGAVFEALGFVCRNLHPWRLAEVTELLPELGHEDEKFFWHGVGRGLYFSPARAVPGASAGAFRRALEEPVNAAGRANAVSGVAWALTLVNLPTPEVPGRLFEHLPRGPRGFRAAIGRGVASALWIWRGAHGMDAQLAAFLDHRTGDAGLWRALVLEPFERILAQPPRVPEEMFRLESSGPTF